MQILLEAMTIVNVDQYSSQRISIFCLEISNHVDKVLNLSLQKFALSFCSESTRTYVEIKVTSR